MDLETYASQNVYQWRNIKGMSASMFLSMWEIQEGKCYICKRQMAFEGLEDMERVAVDHDHRTLALRALLCRGCNLRLGRMEWTLIQICRNPEWSGWKRDYRGTVDQYLESSKVWVDYLRTFGTIG